MMGRYARSLIEQQERSRFTSGLSLTLSLAVAVSLLFQTFGASSLQFEGSWFQYGAVAIFLISLTLAATMWNAKLKATLSAMELIALNIELGDAAEKLES